MKIFVTSDTHNDGVILRKLKEFTSENAFDYIVHCGDIGGKDKNARSLIEFGQYQKEHLKYLLDNFDNILFLLGNDDWFESASIYHLPYCHFKPQNFVAFELVHITPFNTNREANENKICYELNKLDINSESIIVAHDTPYGCLDVTNRGEKVGSTSIRNFIEEYQPKLWLCGHIHESFGIKDIGNTGVFNCACSPEKHLLRGWVIDTDTLNYDKIVI
jgi:Icc-related predicted phosphoesterase